MNPNGCGVIFDMDGVLVGSGPAHAARSEIVAHRHGTPMSDAVFREPLGQRSRDIIRSIWGEGLSDDLVRRIDDEKEAAYREMFAGMVPLTIGTRETLAGLRRAGFALAVATSGPRENIDLVLQANKLAGQFSTIVTGADVTNGKPSPDCFLLAAQKR